MARQPRTSTRASRTPSNPAQTINLIGDLHWGGLVARKYNKMLEDYGTTNHPTPVAHIQLGDMTENGTGVQDTAVVAWLDQLPATWRPTVGNHDTWDGRTGDAAGAAWGHAKNYVYDLTFAVCIFVGPDQCPNGTANVTLSAATLTWLDTQLTTYAARPCLIFCHPPLWSTTTLAFGSTSTDFSVNPRTEFEAILAAHAGQKLAYISGHCHSPIDDPGLVVVKTYGAARVLAVNASAVHYVGTSHDFADPIRSLYLTVTDVGLEVRYRDHGARAWVVGYNNQIVTSLTWV